jgi:carnitine-CoA ligase
MEHPERPRGGTASVPALQPMTVPELLRLRAEADPDVVALVDAGSGSSLTYSELLGRAETVAAVLACVGVEAGDRVASVLPNGIASVEVWFACTLLGAIEAPIHVAYRDTLLANMLELAGPAAIVVATDLLSAVSSALAESMPDVPVLVVGPRGSADDVAAPAEVEPRYLGELTAEVRSEHRIDREPPSISDPACLLFTSGTTGGTSAVLCTYAQEFESAMAAPPVFDQPETIYSTSPPNHVGQKLFLVKALATASSFVMRPSFSVTHFWSDVRRYGCTHTLLIGAAASYLHAQPKAAGEANNPLRSVVMIPLHPEVNDIRERFGIAVHSLYNMTEICPIATITDAEVTDHRTCGRVRDGFDWRLVDEYDREVAVGEPGELILRPDRPWVFSRGYWRDPRKTVEAWRNLWFHTGDMFTVDPQGYLTFLDRKKDVVRRGGENISSAELERVVNALPEVEECAVVGVPSEHTEEEIKLVIVPSGEVELSLRAVHEQLRQQLPPFMVPRYLQVSGELPKTPTMKVRKALLREAGPRGVDARNGFRPAGPPAND